MVKVKLKNPSVDGIELLTKRVYALFLDGFLRVSKIPKAMIIWHKGGTSYKDKEQQLQNNQGASALGQNYIH